MNNGLRYCIYIYIVVSIPCLVHEQVFSGLTHCRNNPATIVPQIVVYIVLLPETPTHEKHMTLYTLDQLNSSIIYSDYNQRTCIYIYFKWPYSDYDKIFFSF